MVGYPETIASGVGNFVNFRIVRHPGRTNFSVVDEEFVAGNNT
jgi:hypothetical protein